MEAPDFGPGSADFQSARRSGSSHDGLPALVAPQRMQKSLQEFFPPTFYPCMNLAPQEIRTFFITSVCYQRRALLQSDRMAKLFIDVLQDNRKKERFHLHEFVVMPNHFHLLITPAHDIPLEKALQMIKGGFSYRMKKELNLNFAIWQPGFTNHRVRDPRDYAEHRAYIHNNPVKARLADRPELYRYSSAFPGVDVDPVPLWLMEDVLAVI